MQFWNDSVNDPRTFIFVRNIHLQHNSQVHFQAKVSQKLIYSGFKYIVQN